MHLCQKSFREGFPKFLGQLFCRATVNRCINIAMIYWARVSPQANTCSKSTAIGTPEKAVKYVQWE